MTAEDAHARRVERADPHGAAQRLAHERPHAGAHLLGGLVREGDGEDVPGGHAEVAHDVGDAVREHAGLARPGTGEDEHGPLGVGHGLGLHGVEAFQEVGGGESRHSGGIPSRRRRHNPILGRGCVTSESTHPTGREPLRDAGDTGEVARECRHGVTPGHTVPQVRRAGPSGRHDPGKSWRPEALSALGWIRRRVPTPNSDHGETPSARASLRGTAVLTSPESISPPMAVVLSAHRGPFDSVADARDGHRRPSRPTSHSRISTSPTPDLPRDPCHGRFLRGATPHRRGPPPPPP